MESYRNYHFQFYRIYVLPLRFYQKSMKVNDTADEPCPIALLPVELLSVMMRYIVGSELDVYCLELLSMTSVGFYLLARYVYFSVV